MLPLDRTAPDEVRQVVTEANTLGPFTAHFNRFSASNKVLSPQLRGKAEACITDVLVITQKFIACLDLAQVVALRLNELSPVLCPHLILLARFGFLKIRDHGGLRLLNKVIVWSVHLIEGILLDRLCNVL